MGTVLPRSRGAAFGVRSGVKLSLSLCPSLLGRPLSPLKLSLLVCKMGFRQGWYQMAHPNHETAPGVGAGAQAGVAALVGVPLEAPGLLP